MLNFLVDAVLTCVWFVGLCLITATGTFLTVEAAAIQQPVIGFMALFAVIILGAATCHFYYQAEDSFNRLMGRPRRRR